MTERRMALASFGVWAGKALSALGYDGRCRFGFGDDAPVDDYELIDAGGGARLERFGEHVTDRPHGGAHADRRAPERWTEADLRFDRDAGWSGPGLAEARDGWSATIGGVELELRPTEAGQVGCFPEHVAMLRWLRDRVELRRATAPGDAPAVRVLHLFAYTGLATLTMAAAGAAVAHVDAARPAVAWARRNAVLNGLGDAPIRWLVDDARAFAARARGAGRGGSRPTSRPCSTIAAPCSRPTGSCCSPRTPSSWARTRSPAASPTRSAAPPRASRPVTSASTRTPARTWRSASTGVGTAQDDDDVRADLGQPIEPAHQGRRAPPGPPGA